MSLKYCLNNSAQSLLVVDTFLSLGGRRYSKHRFHYLHFFTSTDNQLFLSVTVTINYHFSGVQMQTVEHFLLSFTTTEWPSVRCQRRNCRGKKCMFMSRTIHTSCSTNGTGLHCGHALTLLLLTGQCRIQSLITIIFVSRFLGRNIHFATENNEQLR